MKRFWDKVLKSEEPGGCWEWTASKDSFGYGHIRISGRLVKAHRLALELSGQKVPDHLCALHRCDSPGCVRPSHLFIGSKTDNAADRDKKGRAAHGARSGRTKLSEEDVGVIRRARGKITQRRLAEIFGVTHGCIGQIQRGTNWRYV